MTPYDPQAPVPPPVPPHVRELVGLLLILAGVSGIAAAAFTWDWRAGVAFLGALALAFGWRLSTAPE